MISLEEASKWIDKEACIHWPKSQWDDPGVKSGGMIGTIIAIEHDLEGSWIVVDYGYGANLKYVTAIHRPEDCYEKEVQSTT